MEFRPNIVRDDLQRRHVLYILPSESFQPRLKGHSIQLLNPEEGGAVEVREEFGVEDAVYAREGRLEGEGFAGSAEGCAYGVMWWVAAAYGDVVGECEG